MSTKITRSSIKGYRERFAALAKRSAGLQKKGEETIGHLVTAAETSAAAFGFGMLQGRQGPVEIVGVPADLAAGTALHIAGFLGLGGKASGHLHAFADGALASYFFTLGRGVGINMKSGGSAVKGDLTDKEIKELAAD